MQFGSHDRNGALHMRVHTFTPCCSFHARPMVRGSLLPVWDPLSGRVNVRPLLEGLLLGVGDALTAPVGSNGESYIEARSREILEGALRADAQRAEGKWAVTGTRRQGQ